MPQLDLLTHYPFADQPFTEWDKPIKGKPYDSEGAESDDEMIDNTTGAFAD